MASGNEPIRDAAERDGLAEERGNKCVEMETAELMNGFPVLLLSAIYFTYAVSVRQ